jgi:hypothetical protein
VVVHPIPLQEGEKLCNPLTTSLLPDLLSLLLKELLAELIFPYFFLVMTSHVWFQEVTGRV